MRVRMFVVVFAQQTVSTNTQRTAGHLHGVHLVLHRNEDTRLCPREPEEVVSYSSTLSEANSNVRGLSQPLTPRAPTTPSHVV